MTVDPKSLLPYANTMAAIYADDSHPTWQNATKTAHVWLKRAPDGTLEIYFEGTTDIEEWMVDVFCIEVPLLDHPKMGPVHAGFAADIAPLLDAIANAVDGFNYIAIGHSKGGGEVLEFAGEMKDRGHPPTRVIAFEAPRVGTSIMRDYLADIDIVQTATRNIHGTDIICQVPVGPSYVDMRDPLILPVPDSFDIPSKHRMTGVLAGLNA